MNRFSPSLRLIALSALTLVLTGCHTVGPEPQVPAAQLPAHWQEDALARASAGSRAATPWWAALDDPVLDQLIARALQQGLDVREAAARVQEARARRGFTVADRGPTVDAIGSYSRRDDSDRTAGALPSDAADDYRIGLGATWELDLWGRVRRAVQAADAELRVAEEDARAVALTLAAETALTYVELREYEQRFVLAETNLELQQHTLDLVRARFEAGAVGERDLAQALTNVELTRSRLPILDARRRSAENRLALLVGQVPGTLRELLAQPADVPIVPVEVAIGVPAEVIRRRPDVRRAEQQVLAEQARIGVARAERFPQLSLSGSLGIAAENASDLSESGSGFFGLGPSVRWTLFDGGRLRQRVAIQDARAEQAMIQWERTILLALEESENALSGLVRGQSHRHSLLAAASQARRAVELARIEYREGMSDFQPVLDSERALAQLEDQLAQADASLAMQYIALQRAIGG